MSISTPDFMPGNEATRCVPFPALVPAAWPMERLLQHHHEQLNELLELTPVGSCLAVAFYRNKRITTHATMSASTDEASSLVVGRHRQAALCLRRDRSIALRHLLLRYTVVDTDSPRIALLDLNTGQGFRVDGLGHVQAAEANGPLLAHIGEYSLLVVPVVPEHGSVYASRPSQSSGLAAGKIEPAFLRSYSNTAITQLPSVTQLGHDVVPGPLPPNCFATLRVRVYGGDVTFGLTRDDLTRGVLLGRYGRCDIRVEHLHHPNAVSRVHLLLMLDADGEVRAIDTASSNGTRIDGQPVHGRRLPSRALIELSEGNALHWERADASLRITLLN